MRSHSNDALYFSGSDGTRLFYEIIGEGRPVVLCDGLVCDGYIWKYLLAELGSVCRFHHGHYPGHGQSDGPPRFADVSPPRLADDVALLLREAGVPKATIVGHSMGVQVALETWRRHPDLVESLLLICGSPGNIVRDFHEGPLLGYVVPILDAMGRFMPDLVARPWQKIPARLMIRLAGLTREVNPRLIRESDFIPYFEGLGRVDFRLAVQMLESAGRHDATPYLREIDVPVLIIAGAEDRFTPPARSQMMADRIPESELMMVAGGTHSVLLEQPDLVNLRIKRFLEERLFDPAGV